MSSQNEKQQANYVDFAESDKGLSGFNVPSLTEQVHEGEIIDLKKFNPEDLRMISQIEQSISLHDSNTIMSFAVAPQSKLNKHLDPLLEGIKGNDIGYAGSLIGQLALPIKEMNLSDVQKEIISGNTGIMSLMPNFVRKQFSALQKFRAQSMKIRDMLTKVESEANQHMIKLHQNTENMDKLLNVTLENIEELQVWLAGGQQALLRMRQEYEDAKEKALSSRDNVELAKVRDMAEQISAFETRLVRINIAYTESILAIPQIRTQQQAGRIEFSNMMDTILQSIPNIKRAVIQLSGLEKINEASKGSKAAQILNSELSQIGITSLETAYLRAKDSQAGDLETIQRLSATADKIVQMMDKGNKIDEENRPKRDEAVKRLGVVRDKLAEGLKANHQLALTNVK